MKEVRPTSGRVLLALFNILGDIEGANFLDLFAGTGHVGLEALKRGANSCIFVENVKSRAENIKKIAQAAKNSIILSLEIRRAVNWLVKHEKKFNIIFADPPYNSGWCDEILTLQNFEKLFDEKCIFIIEHSSREDMNVKEGFELISKRSYGETCLTFLKKTL